MSNEIEKKVEQEIKRDLDSDWFLEMLINMVNGTEGYIGITLNIGGIILTGDLVSGHKYFEWFADAFSHGIIKTDDPEGVKKVFLSLGDVYLKDKDAKSFPPSFIHIRDAKFFQPGGDSPIPTTEGIWWRGKITAIDGIVLGKIAIGNK